MENKSIEKVYNKLIIALSIIIPLVVALLFRVNLKELGFDVAPLTFLPPIYATINGITAILLVIAVRAIKNGNRIFHERLVKIAMMCSVLFLIMYVAYHMTSDSVVYPDTSFKPVYLFILITHILLSIVIIPLVLITYLKAAITKEFDKHKKIARITFPLWFYVAVSGVIVYLMISPYYGA